MIIFIFLPLLLFANFIDFSKCYKKYSFIKESIPINKHLSIKFTTKNKCPYIYDDFTNMCIFPNKNKKIVKLFSNYELGWWGASIKENSVYAGNFAKKSYFLTPSYLSIKTENNSIISDIFCRVQGVGFKGGFIDSDKISHFINFNYWGDIGIEIDKNLRIISLDPFYIHFFKINDKVKYINGKKASLELWKKYILLGTEGELVNINGMKIPIRKKIYNFTPLIYFGIKVNKKLIATFPNYIYKKYLIKKGKIVKINDIVIKNFKHLNYILSSIKTNIKLTLNNEGIIFNIYLNKDDIIAKNSR